MDFERERYFWTNFEKFNPEILQIKNRNKNQL